jgi:hypothetical protein
MMGENESLKAAEEEDLNLRCIEHANKVVYAFAIHKMGYIPKM